MMSELEGRNNAPAETGTAGEAAEVSSAATAGSTAAVESTATVESTAASNETAAETALPATTHTAIPVVEARDTMPSPPDAAGVRNSLEAIKTALVWLVVIQLLTILSPLLPTSLKWSIIVGLVLLLSSFAIGSVAYLKARQAQRAFPE